MSTTHPMPEKAVVISEKKAAPVKKTVAVKKELPVKKSAPKKITLAETVRQKIETLTSNGIDSPTGREVALKHILEEVAGGHVETDLEGLRLKAELQEMLKFKK